MENNLGLKSESIFEEYLKAGNSIRVLNSIKDEKAKLYNQKYNEFINKTKKMKKIFYKIAEISVLILIISILGSSLLTIPVVKSNFRDVILWVMGLSSGVTLPSIAAYSFIDIEESKVRFTKRNIKDIEEINKLEERINSCVKSESELFKQYELIKTSIQRTTDLKSYEDVYSYSESDNKNIDNEPLKSDGPVKSIGKLRN